VTEASSAARLAVCALAAVLWLVAASEARAEDGSGAQDPAAEVMVDPAQEGTTPVEGSVEQQPSAEQPVEQAPVEPSAPESPAVDPGPPTEQPPVEPAPPASEAPAPEAPAPEQPVVVEPEPPAEPPAVAPPPVDLIPEPPVPDAEPVPVDVPTASGSRHASIVTISGDVVPPSLPSLFPSPGGGLAAVSWAGDRLDTQGGSRSETRNEGTPAADRTGDAPLLPPLPFRDGTSSGFYVSAGGASGGSSGGFVPLVLAGLIALFAAAAQRPGGLVSLALAPPRCTAFVLCLERPD
jgi:hypothetical protein